MDGVKIITNCGFGKKISSKAELISRLTASQSTLTINDTSITKFERNKLINRVFGNSIKNTFKTIDLKFKTDKDLIGCSASHNGYEKNFNCIHKREVYLDQNNNNFEFSSVLELVQALAIIHHVRVPLLIHWELIAYRLPSTIVLQFWAWKLLRVLFPSVFN